MFEESRKQNYFLADNALSPLFIAIYKNVVLQTDYVESRLLPLAPFRKL